jgi:hypothetical protein
LDSPEIGMGVFKDRTGRDWHVDINVSALRRIRTSGLNVDLLDVTDSSKDLVQRLLDDPVLLVGVLYEVCRPEIEQRGVTAEEFGEALSDGGVIDAATTVLLESLANFIPSHRGRAMAQAAVQAMTLVDNLGLLGTVEELLARYGSPSTN